MLIPKKGWSDADKPALELFDPEANQVFVEELRRIIAPRIPIEEVDLHITDPAFAKRAVELLDQMIRSRKR